VALAGGLAGGQAGIDLFLLTIAEDAAARHRRRYPQGPGRGQAACHAAGMRWLRKNAALALALVASAARTYGRTRFLGATLYSLTRWLPGTPSLCASVILTTLK
jgi:hypothetical protein